MNQRDDNIDLSSLDRFVSDVLRHSLGKVEEAMDSVDQSNLQDFIQNTFNKSKPGVKNNRQEFNNNTSTKKGWPEPKFVEIHGFYIVRFNMPEQIDDREINAYLGGGQLRIRWSPKIEEQVILLPGHLVFADTKAILKDNILEFRFPVNSNLSFQKIEIQYL